MSRYMETTTVFDNPEHLVSALMEMGFSPVVHEKPVQLTDWHGRLRPEKAEIVIPRHNTGLGSSNDVGFYKDGGTYKAIISEYDKQKFNQTWLGKLAQRYSVVRTLAVAKAKGYALKSRSEIEGKVKLVFTI